MREIQRTRGCGKGNDLIRRCAPPSPKGEGFWKLGGFMEQDFTGTGNEPRRSMREGYRIFDAGERMWLECRQWYDGLGWVDFWTHRAADAMRFPGAKSARRMVAKLEGERLGALVVVNRKGAAI